ncbi:alpha/beta fold hydrolase [Amycolatopsis rhabdoformis]|uniref:Alpha/beta fold hydrolase n=1 Tax=Amycolatopsis rhabdoformis TaxID=1448059 RepID=A0ABZ1ICX1_9PSEU|nr:alpha/beta fold hydrolase [Amycolatopsis rhabdoformis]WSE32309.1 alpha/beta fold hydrolase [Amycolatopsis rhabdoformis]
MPIHSLGDGVDLFYDVHGDARLPGEPVLLVTGTTASVGLWTPAIIDGLAVDRQVIAYDHRGMGGSSAYPEAVSMASLAADAVALLEELGTGPVHVVGWSLGSAVAQELALARPDLVASLVLYGTWARGDGFQRCLVTALRCPWQHGDLAGAIAALGVAFSPELLDSPEFDQRIASVLPLFPRTDEQIRAVVRQWDADLAHDTLDRLPGIDRPTTVLVGAQDLLTPPRLSRAVAVAIPGAEFVLVEGAGSSHSLHVERPDEWLKHVRAHLARCA